MAPGAPTRSSAPAGADTIDAKGGFDTVFGLSGNDRIEGGKGGDAIQGDATVRGGPRTTSSAAIKPAEPGTTTSRAIPVRT